MLLRVLFLVTHRFALSTYDCSGVITRGLDFFFFFCANVVPSTGGEYTERDKWANDRSAGFCTSEIEMRAYTAYRSSGSLANCNSRIYSVCAFGASGGRTKGFALSSLSAGAAKTPLKDNPAVSFSGNPKVDLFGFAKKIAAHRVH